MAKHPPTPAARRTSRVASAAGARKRPRRVRRSPEEARALILDAAERVLAELGPDAAGLKDVAREAGVSHGLVSHYYGTYDVLVEATLERYVAQVRARLIHRLADLGDDALDAVERIVDEIFEAFAGPGRARLVLWALLSGRLDREDFFPRRKRGMKGVADAIEAAAARGPLPSALPREDVEVLVIQVLSSIFGYLLGRSVFWESLGRKATAQRDAAFRRGLARSIRSYLLARL
jgi:TetR/AcrR family transcriptional regulator, repressor for neighboring sulfatase